MISARRLTVLVGILGAILLTARAGADERCGCSTIDSGDGEAYAATFTPDSVFNNTFKGKEGLVAFIQQWTGKMNGGSRRHWNNNLVITPTAEGANGSVYLMLLDIGARPPVVAAVAKYTDVLVKTPQGWRFKTRNTRPDAPPKPPE